MKTLIALVLMTASFGAQAATFDFEVPATLDSIESMDAVNHTGKTCKADDEGRLLIEDGLIWICIKGRNGKYTWQWAD